MSHEDTLLMIDAILAVALACKTIALTLSLCTIVRVFFSIVLAKRPCSS